MERDDVIQLQEKLDPPEAEDDVVWQILENTHTPRSGKKKKEALHVFEYFITLTYFVQQLLQEKWRTLRRS